MVDRMTVVNLQSKIDQIDSTLRDEAGLVQQIGESNDSLIELMLYAFEDPDSEHCALLLNIIRTLATYYQTQAVLREVTDGQNG